MAEQLDLFMQSAKREDEEVKNEESELTTRQKEVWQLIEHNSLVEHRKTTQREIVDKVEGFVWNDDIKAHDHCTAIWSDIRANNESMEHDRIIISKNFEYWIGSERETKMFIVNLWKALSPRLTRYWKYLKKLGLEGQEDIFSEEFHEVFNKYDVEMQKQLGEVEQ